LNLAAILSHFSIPILKTSCRIRRYSIFLPEGAQGVAKGIKEVLKPGAHSKVASVSYVFQRNFEGLVLNVFLIVFFFHTSLHTAAWK